MNGSKSPDAPARQASILDHAPPSADATGNNIASPLSDKASPQPSIEDLPDAPADDVTAGTSVPNGDNDGAESEAETIMTSPVKKKEAEKQQQQQPAVKVEERPQRSRIGGLPVPGDEDDDLDSSPRMSTENATPAGRDEDAEMPDRDQGSGKDAEANDSDELSSPDSDEDAEGEEDENPQSRPRSEGLDGETNGADSPNPRKRKHRASSASLPQSKRQSMDPPKRRLRGMNSEADATGMERSASPIMQSHRRAVSTQSAVDGRGEGGERKRKTLNQYPVKEPKLATARSGWEESDASSETASRGHADEVSKRATRGLGRSTSTPGRPVGREHKRYINRYGFTRFAEACEQNNLDLAKQWREKDPDQLELAEFAGNKPLQIAALNGNAEVVSYLIAEGCQIDCANLDKDTPLIDAAENGHTEVVKLLLDAGVDPLRQNLKGQQALDVVTDEIGDSQEIRSALHRAIDTWNSSSARLKREEEDQTRHRAGPSKELHFMARTYENLLRLVAINDRNGVREFLAARVPVDNIVIATAAKTGDVYLVNMLLAEMSDKKMHQRTEKPMLAVLGSSHWEMVQALTELETFDPTWVNRQGQTWPEIAEERKGPMWRQERELLQKLHDDRGKSLARRSSSPVSRRDGGKRFLRRPNVDDEESEDDGAPKKKNSRRLMSRKDMLAANGKNISSDSSSEDEDADAEGEVEDDDLPGAPGATEMKPPGSPQTRLRASGRTRSKSITSPVSDVSPKTRRRSASMRELEGAGERVGKENNLPVLDEGAEDTPGRPEVKSEERQKEEAAHFAIKEAQRLAAKQQETFNAEAEAKRVEEAEARRVRDEEDKKREDERLRQEDEEAELARREAAQEAERASREAAQVEEARMAKLSHEREQYRNDVLASLPPGVRHVLAPDSDFTYEGLEEKAFLVEHFTPLRVIRLSGNNTDEKMDQAQWLLNLQVAPLIGKVAGLELMYGAATVTDLTAKFRTLDIDVGGCRAEERSMVDEVLDTVSTSTRPGLGGAWQGDWEAELERTAERLASLQSMQYWALHRNDVANHPHEGEGRAQVAELRLVHLDDVMRELHPLLADVDVEVEDLEDDELDGAVVDFDDEEEGFFARIGKIFGMGVRCGIGTGEEGVLGWTTVGVAEEK